MPLERTYPHPSGARVVWSPDRGWHDDGATGRLIVTNGRIRFVEAERHG